MQSNPKSFKSEPSQKRRIQTLFCENMTLLSLLHLLFLIEEWRSPGKVCEIKYLLTEGIWWWSSNTSTFGECQVLNGSLAGFKYYCTSIQDSVNLNFFQNMTLLFVLHLLLIQEWWSLTGFRCYCILNDMLKGEISGFYEWAKVLFQKCTATLMGVGDTKKCNLFV